MINKIVIDTVKKMNEDYQNDIKCYFMQSPKTQNSKYILFNTYLEKDTDIFDNKSLSVCYYIQLHYWYNSLNDMIYYQSIKKTFKDNGFKFDGCKDIKDGDYYCKAMTFVYKDRVKETDLLKTNNDCK